ncbi:MAG: hypothetical protein GEU83_15155 [Pseudonocardiaceae bacterium]|nr:hypothetical protein [Pseudonocardiaceae bacterium]
MPHVPSRLHAQRIAASLTGAETVTDVRDAVRTLAMLVADESERAARLESDLERLRGDLLDLEARTNRMGDTR